MYDINCCSLSLQNELIYSDKCFKKYLSSALTTMCKLHAVIYCSSRTGPWPEQFLRPDQYLGWRKRSSLIKMYRSFWSIQVSQVNSLMSFLSLCWRSLVELRLLLWDCLCELNIFPQHWHQVVNSNWYQHMSTFAEEQVQKTKKKISLNAFSQ